MSEAGEGPTLFDLVEEYGGNVLGIALAGLGAHFYLSVRNRRRAELLSVFEARCQPAERR